MEDKVNYYNLSELILGEAAKCIREVLIARYEGNKRGKIEKLTVNDQRWKGLPAPLTIRYFLYKSIRFYPFMRFSSFVFDQRTGNFKTSIKHWDFSSLFQALCCSYEMPLKTQNSQGVWCDRFKLQFLQQGLIKQKVGRKVYVLSKRHIRNVMMNNSKCRWVYFSRSGKLPGFSKFGFFNPNAYTTPEETLREIRNAFIGHTSSPTLDNKKYKILIEWVYEAIKELYREIGTWDERKENILMEIRNRTKLSVDSSSDGTVSEPDQIDQLVEDDVSHHDDMWSDQELEFDLFCDEFGVLDRKSTQVLKGTLGNYEILNLIENN